MAKIELGIVWLLSLLTVVTQSDIMFFFSVIASSTVILLQVKPIPEQNHDLVLTVGGFIFGGALAGVVGYYFGATKNDKKVNNED